MASKLIVPLRTALSAAALWSATALPTASALAQENLEMGKMWTFENPPLPYLEATYGFTPTQDWLDNLRMASLRLDSGCSASFVSPKGLIMTNHHCVRDLIAQAQGPNNWVESGYFAATPEDEVKLPGVKAQQLVAMEDVTEAMNEGIGSDLDAAAAQEQREANEEKIIAAAEEAHPGMEPQVVALFQGAIYQLYIYKNYEDIRLVVAPHLQTAHFGGDPDNFTYPRYSIDFSFCRAWEDGAPADTSGNYFQWSKVGPVEGELTFVTGNPGTTNRLKTQAQLEVMRDVELPVQLAMVTGQLKAFRDIVEQFPQAKKQLETTILGLENSEKATTGYLGGLLDPQLMTRKTEAEAAFRKRVDSDPAQKEQFGGAWDELAKVAKAKRDAFLRSNFYDEILPMGPLARAVLVVQATNPDASSEERSAATGMAQSFNQVRLNPLQADILELHFGLGQEWLGKDDPWIKAVMGSRSAEETLAALSASKMSDNDYVSQLLEGGRDAVQSSDDLAIQAALVLAPLKDKAQADFEAIETREETLGAQIGRALHAAYGTNVSPDATFSLRFSEGLVEGYPFNGTLAPWRTSFYGLYARSTDFDNTYPFNLPQPWLDNAGDIDMAKGVNFVSSNDIIGGNSGSPIVNKDLEVIGLIFDGNIEMLPNNFLYRGDVPRSVSVHVDAIVEALSKIYGAERVLDELSGR